MNSRIEKLRRQSLDAQPYISPERALLLTDFCGTGAAERNSVPVARALAFKYILEHKELCLNKGELIVGERGPAPKATPTYPEICTHTLNDYDILRNREKIPFKVAEETVKFQEDRIIPFWSRRSIRDRIFEEVDDEWKAAYEAGVFTEFQEQRAPGHTVLDDKIYYRGFLDFKKDISQSMQALDFENDEEALSKREQLRAMDIAAEAIIAFANRYADKLRVCAASESDTKRKAELEEMVRICARVPAHAPETYWEALQYYWFVHLGVITELNTWDSFNPGRLDQHLLPFYCREIESGKLNEERAREILQSFWIKFNNQPAPPKVGVTAKESNTYTDFCLINLGGLTESGEDAANEMTYLILDVIEEMRLLQPSSMVQISKKNPDRLLKRSLEIIRTGYGQPSLFNTDAIIQELIRQGKSVADARNGGASGCVETGAFGKESYILTGYFNLTKVLEITLHNGVDPKTKKQIGLQTGDPVRLKSFDDFYAAFEKQLKHFIDIKIKGNRIIEDLWGRILPAPFMSILIDDCIKTGKDYNNGGARYNTSYVQGVGLGSLTDSLAAIKHHIYDRGSFDFSRLMKGLETDFEVDSDLRGILLDFSPKYGNDEDYADDIARMIFESFFDAVDGRPNVKGGHFRINLLPTTSHVYFGSVI
ncbi:MAG: formate C-acetyltransferase/glycerol dehydratase family glycyl radical enzyme, partial [FCB group bacterium]|nr:formate C-acetyltransferase/glycerol dehydratase family glycyl radical enzyme [FCB group bacterium]